jgi:hypothetical protein
MKARFTHKPAPGSIASEAMGEVGQEDQERAGAVSDAVVTDDDASVWDARPVAHEDRNKASPQD